jgi:hypothetical protein
MAILFSFGCNDNENNNDNDNELTPTTVAQDKENISATFENSLDLITEMRDGNFIQSLFKFLQLNDGEVLSEVWIDKMNSELSNVITQDPIIENRLDYSTLTGTYTWDLNTETWSKTTNSNMVIRFPSTENSTINDCEFIFSNYRDKSFVVNNETIYLPTEIDALLKKNDFNIMSLSAVISYNTSGFPIPNTATIELLLEPTNFTLQFDKLTETQFENQLDIVSPNYSTSLHTKISIANNDYENLQDDDFNNIQLSFTRDKMNITGSWDIKTYNNLSSPTTDDLNNTVNLVMNYNEQKIGDLKFKDIGDETLLFIYYKDQTFENMSIYYEPFISDFEAAFSSYFGFNFLKNKKNNIKKYTLKRKISSIFKK